MRVLLVEDEPSIAEPLVVALGREGHDVVHAPDGTSALAAHADAAPPFELVLLDLRLPDMDGFDVCRALRARGDVPIIIVSARGEEIDTVLGLELGADDYLVKPFGVRVLLARMNAVMRRRAPVEAVEAAVGTGADAAPIRSGELEVDERAHLVRVAGEVVDLTPTEFALAAYLVRRPGAACSRDQLLADVWETSWTGSTKTVDVHVASLRRKLGERVRIDTVRGIGYRLVPSP
ncbi:MAG: DNA-binding response regulator [Thermoleophilia bacterium]|nr:DNA-binding response regulator [Thermoleophilia bacterium]